MVAALRTPSPTIDLDAARGRNVSSGSVFSTILLNHVIRTCGSVRAERVVDVGCGQSPFADLMQPTTYVGVDHVPLGPPHGLVAAADAGALPLRGAVFDGVICTEVIEHVPDEYALAAELARVATPGATLVLSSPFVHGLHEAPYDFRRLTSIGLVRVLEAAGWRVERVVPIGGPLVVAVDSGVRWGTSRVRAIARRVPAGVVRNAVLRAPERVQRQLARLALRGRTGRCGGIDPFRAVPTLTLGYVVVARLERRS